MKTFFDQLVLLVQKAWTTNETWRFIASLALLVVGFSLLETLWRFANRRVQAAYEKRGISAEAVDLLTFLPSFRLASAGLLLWISAAFLVLPPQLRQLVRGIEIFLLALSAIVFLFQLVGLLNRVRLALPKRVQETISEDALRKFAGFLRIAILVGIATVVIYTQKAFLPQWLWQYAWWRYLLVLGIFILVYIGMRLVAGFLSTMTVALRDVEEKVRLRLRRFSCFRPQQTVWQKS